jgi:Mce-associated membrane protein
MASNALAHAGQLSEPPAEESTPRATEPGDHDGDRHRSTTEATSAVASDAEADHNAEADRETQVEDAKCTRKPMPPRRFALIVGLVVTVALGALAGWLGLRAHQSHESAQQRAVFLQAARQGALNLTTISYTEVDADIKRILDSSTGAFYDDFQKRSQPFVDVVKQAQSRSVGTITEAGLESMQRDTAQVLVAVSVKTSNAGAAEQQPRGWRMRISVQKLGDTAKVSNVEFVP